MTESFKTRAATPEELEYLKEQIASMTEPNRVKPGNIIRSQDINGILDTLTEMYVSMYIFVKDGEGKYDDDFKEFAEAIESLLNDTNKLKEDVNALKGPVNDHTDAVKAIYKDLENKINRQDVFNLVDIKEDKATTAEIRKEISDLRQRIVNLESLYNSAEPPEDEGV